MLVEEELGRGEGRRGMGFEVRGGGGGCKVEKDRYGDEAGEGVLVVK